MQNDKVPDLTQEQKLAKLKTGQYKFKVPPVLHGSWDDKAWIDYIDVHGVWQ